MFSNLRKKLNNALQGSIIISESLQQSFIQRASNSSEAAPTTENWDQSRRSLGNSSTLTTFFSGDGASGKNFPINLPPNVSITAGCQLLAKYEDDWKAIHDTTVDNGKKAAEVAELIEGLARRTIHQRTVMTDLISCLSAIPSLTETLNASSEVLKSVQELCADVEENLEHLEVLCEQCELQELKLQKEYELSQYKKLRMSQLEVYRQKRSAQHEEKVRRHEERWLAVQRERQAVFEDAFRSDMAEFKLKGSLAKLEQKETTRSDAVALEEIDLADIEPKDALEEFLSGL